MAAWESHAIIAILVGYQIAVFGTVTSSGFIHNQPLFIIAFLLYTSAALIAALIKLGELSSNFIVAIFSIALLVISGVFYVVGVGVWAGAQDSRGFSIVSVGVTFDITATILAFVGVAFQIISLVVAPNGSKATASVGL